MVLNGLLRSFRRDSRRVNGAFLDLGALENGDREVNTGSFGELVDKLVIVLDHLLS